MTTVGGWLLGAGEVLAALRAMTMVELSLRTTDLPTTCARLGLRYDLHGTTPPAPERALLPRRARRVLRGCAVVLACWPAGGSCLRRCLLLGHRLRRFDPVLRIGVRRTDDGRFSAHSWLEIGGRTLDPEASAFAPLTSPTH